MEDYDWLKKKLENLSDREKIELLKEAYVLEVKENTELKSQLQTAQVEAEAAKGLINELFKKGCIPTMWKKLEDFLTSTPPQATELCMRCGKAKATRCTPEGVCEKCWQEEFGGSVPQDKVLVRRGVPEEYCEMQRLIKGWLDAECEPRHAPPNLISRSEKAISIALEKP